MKEGNLKKKRLIRINKSFLPLVNDLNQKRETINKFVLQIEQIPVYIMYHKVSANSSRLVIQDPGNETTRIIPIDLDDSLTHLLFLLSLIKDEYNSKVLFTNKSHLHE
jgi:hypothetical protein